MAEFLVRRYNHPLKDVAIKTAFTTAQLKTVDTCQEIGDIIQVYEDGVCKEAPVASSPHYLIKVSGLDKKEWDYLNSPKTHTETKEVDGKEVTVEVMDKRRRYQVNFSFLSAEDKARIEKEYVLELKSDTWQKIVYDKADDIYIESVKK